MTEFANVPGVTKHTKTKAITTRKKKNMREPFEMETEPAEARHNDLNYVDALIVTFFFSLRKKVNCLNTAR